MSEPVRGGVAEVSDENRWIVDLRRSRTANGGWEWYFLLGSTPIYPNSDHVGVFTSSDVKPAEAFALVLRQWGIRS